MNGQKYTFGLLKRRILRCLEETGCEGGVFFSDTERDRIQTGMADAVNAALARMYESLPVGERSAVVYINSPALLASARGIEGSKRERIFFEPREKIGVFFTMFGSGSVVFYNGDGNEVFHKDFDGTKVSFTPVRFLEENCCEVCCMEATGDIHLRDVCIYDGEGIADESLFAPKGYCSFTLPSDFGGFSKKGFESDITTKANTGYVKMPDGIKNGADCMEIHYKACPCIIDDSTPDSFELSLSPIMFEALVNLASSELCSENMPSIYTRLVYKYNDLTESCFSFEKMSANRRNSFYKSSRGRW